MTTGWLAAAPALLLVAGIGCRNNSPPAAVPRAAEAPEVSPASKKTDFKPTEGFVGSQTCIACHAEIARRYQQHPMAHSLDLAASEAAPKTGEQAEVAGSGPRRYRAERTEAGIFHHESLRDENAALLYDQAVPIRYVLGSGQRGKAYLIQRDGLLFQSSLGWYAGKGTWDLSPGYDPAQHQRFGRRVDDGCLFCHVGRTNPIAGGSGRYRDPPFLELAIGCERCHGPGKRHVEFHSSDDATGSDDIVKISELSRAQRNDICFQCHLQTEQTFLRRGRSAFDFRPGNRLDDIWVPFVAPDNPLANTNNKAVNQVQQMRASRCYQASSGELTCTSCHDPHANPDVKSSAAYYRDRCLQCHGNDDCSLPSAEQAQSPASGSCVHCHMPAASVVNVPHTAQSDHRILRKPESAPFASQEPTALEDLVIFGGAEQRLPADEIARARGLAMMSLARLTSDSQLSLSAERLLLPNDWQTRFREPWESLGDDTTSLEALGLVYVLTNRPQDARACWEHSLTFDPDNEPILDWLVKLCDLSGDTVASRQYVERLLAVNPYVASQHLQHAKLLEKLGESAAGIDSAVCGIELDPTSLALREWLIEAYRTTGQADESNRQKELAEKIKRLLESSSPAEAPERKP